MGCHCLPRDEGFWSEPVTPRLERRCRLYASRTIGDKKLLLFERSELQDIRDKWPSFFSGPDTVQDSCGRKI